MSQLSVDSITGRVSGSAPSFPNGAVVTGVVTATSFSGAVTGNVTGNVSGNVTGNADTATTATTATNALGLSGSPNIVVGSVTGTTASFSGNVSVGGTLTYEDVTNIDSVGLVTARTGIRVTAGGIVVNSGVTTLTTLIPDETRFKSVAEEIKVGTGTSVTIDFDGGDGNIGFVASPTGPVSLYVNDIPTTGFTNKVISLTVIINQGATGYACSSVYFNGTQKTLRWSSGTVSAGNTSCVDYYNFVGIDTVGDGAIASYTVTASANGDFRYY